MNSYLLLGRLFIVDLLVVQGELFRRLACTAIQPVLKYVAMSFIFPIIGGRGPHPIVQQSMNAKILLTLLKKDDPSLCFIS